MSWQHVLHPQIDLQGSKRISEQDASRQRLSAKRILESFVDTPGQILADEVGMGKTFVALAVAASVGLKDNRPVVIMVPPAVLEKWQRDFSVFVENCLPPSLRSKLNMAVAENGVEFLKLLDDPPERRKQVVFLAHGALSRNLSDAWVKLAIIQRAFKYRHNAGAHYRAVTRFAGRLVRMERYTHRYPGLWQALLDKPTSNWLKILQQTLDEEEAAYYNDDPVPEDIVRALDHPDVKPLIDDLWNEIQCIPKRASPTLVNRLTQLRQSIQSNIMPRLWQLCFLKTDIQLPLLILDEAHHLKNAGTRLASMFHSPDAESDANVVSQGQLAGVFERMLFLTATPFQLGHHELCSILERFNGINWQSPAAPSWGKTGYQLKLEQLQALLDTSQRQAQSLERKWGLLREDDLLVDGRQYDAGDVDQWWADICENTDADKNINVLQRTIEETVHALGQANRALSELVVRHSRPTELSVVYSEIPRRRRLTGNAIASHDDTHQDCECEGLKIESSSALPFLLAARYIAQTPGQRPVTAEGLASSYEAFLETRQNLLEGKTGPEIEDDVVTTAIDVDDNQLWYLHNIKQAVKPGNRVLSEMHPKIGPVIDKIIELWERGEKVLVFCHYVKTGRALRTHVSYQIRQKLYDKAARKLGCDNNDVAEQLEKNGKRFRKESGLYKRTVELVDDIMKEYANLQSCRDDLLDIVHRFMITPTFLVRYFEFAGSQVQPETLHLAFNYKEKGGLSFTELLALFFEFLNNLTTNERSNYLSALDSIQTGDISLHSDTTEDDKDAIMAAVRLINGSVKHESRQNLMLAFNTPFYPEILIASSVLAEGVDLHLNCRHLIHYDLSWNPSDLEQRTGRVDRLGAKAEKVGQPIHIYYPYLAGTQDEKMYRVVMDRDRWFNVVMGGGFKVDYETTEKISERIPLPTMVLERLKLNLSV